MLQSDEKCKVCGEYLKRNGRDRTTLFYWCENCGSHYNYDNGEMLKVEGPKDDWREKNA